MEIIFILLLAILYFKVPPSISEYSNTILGKFILLSATIHITLKHGLLCGILSSLVMIVLIHHSFEGMKLKHEKKQRRKQPKKKKPTAKDKKLAEKVLKEAKAKM